MKNVESLAAVYIYIYNSIKNKGSFVQQSDTHTSIIKDKKIFSGSLHPKFNMVKIAK